MTDSTPEVWLFYPRGGGDSIRDAVRSKCEDEGWRLYERSTSQIRFPTGRPIQKVTPEDATNLYRSIHTRSIGVWQLNDANVPIRPNPKNSPRRYVPLRRFVQYKAFHHRIGPNRFSEQWADSADAFRSWIQEVGCEGEADPRCLPFHVFETDLGKYDLVTSDGRQRFERDHGRQSSRYDDNELLWKRPPAQQMHGQLILQVAGRTLVQGFHWDVSSQRNSHTITNTWETWKIRRNGHVNIYPNAHIRGSKNASRIHSIGKQKPT